MAKKIKPYCVITTIAVLAAVKIILSSQCVQLNIWNKRNLDGKDPDLNVNSYETQREISQLVKTAVEMKTKPVMFSLVNDAFLPFVLSWLCNTKTMDIHSKVLLIATDTQTKKAIHSLWPNIKVETINVDGSLHGSQTYSHAGYIRLVIKRTVILSSLLENNIETFMFEVDALWLKNSVPMLHSHINQFDMLFHGVSDKSEKINGGFLYLFPTQPTKAVFKALNRLLLQLDRKLKHLPSEQCISEQENDQEYLSKLVYMEYANAKSKVFPLTEFADGKWYSLLRIDRLSFDPFLINFNWIVGNKNKISRAKQWGHWFLKEDFSCDEDQVKYVLQ